MAYNILKNSSAVILLSSLFAVASCSSDVEAPALPDVADGMEVVIKGLPSRSEEMPGSSPELSVFQFSAGRLLSSASFDSYNGEKISLVKGETTDIYFASGVSIDAPAGSSLADFLKSTVSSPSGAASAPLFFTASSPVTDDMGGLELTMKRGVARIDLDASAATVEIEEIVVRDAPAASYVFEGQEPREAETVSYSRSFATAPDGMTKNVFMLFESAEPVNVDVVAALDGVPVTIKAVLESVERNKVYTLRVYDSNVSLGASFSVSDWEDGGVLDGGLDGGRALLIDMDNSWFPEGVSVDYANNLVEVPGTGAEGMKLAFLSELRVDIDSVAFSGERVVVDSVAERQVRISVEKPVNSLAGVLSKFGVDVDSQMKGRPGYEFRIYVKKCSMAVAYDYVTVRVAPSPVQIETVRIAGYDWMAFNCTTPDLDDQIYVDEGLSVEDMYVKDWVKCVGGIFQFGRQYSYVPYQGYNPSNDLGGQTQDMPWIHYSHMPCPEGYHVPSLSEMRSLFPHGVTIPGTYTAGNGESITVELVRLPGDVETPTNVNGVCRYLKFISNETGNCLILPLAGWKGDKSTAASANFGRDGVYWSNNCENCAGGHAKAWRFMFNWGDSCEMQEFQFAMEAFAYVRAIKNY